MRKKRFIIPGLILFVIVLAFKHVLFIGYVPSESMEPTLKAGSYIIGSRIYGELKTGDIIIFEHDGKMLVKRIAAEGHIVGNHTWSHPDMSKISTQEAFSEELNRVSALYQETTGQEMVKFYRPPQGKYSTQNLQMAKDLGYQTFFWSLAYVDWYQDQQPTHEEAFEKLTGRIHPGAIVLLHNTSSTNAEILDELLTKWEEMGYSFGSLDQLISKSA